MASSTLFQALLLAASLGWNGVFAQDANSTTSAGGPTIYAPMLGVSEASLLVPTTTATSSSSSHSQPPIAYSPATGQSETSLEVPQTSSTPLVAPYPVLGHSDTSLDIPTTSTSARPTRTWRRPTTEHTRTSLDVPTDDGGRPVTHTPTLAPSPATGHTQSSLDVPTTTAIAPIVVTAKSQTELEVPTRGPTTGVAPTIPVPPDDGGRPTQFPAHHQHDNGPATEEVNPGGIIASLVHEHSEQWNGGDATTAPPERESAYHFLGTQIAAGASAATIDGTTYELAPSGDGIYVNGHKTTLATASATDSVAMAVMSGLGGGGGQRSTSDGSSGGGSSTLATATSTAPSTGSQGGSSSAGPAEQTGNSAALVLPGVGLGGVGLLMALI